MDGGISSLFGSDNPFKFFFLAGVLLLITSLYYPFEKKHELDIQRNKVELSDSTLRLELITLQKEVKSLSVGYGQVIEDLDSLQQMKAKTPSRIDEISAIINQKKIDSNEKLEEITRKKYDLEVKVIQLNFMKKEIEIYQSHLSEFKNYSIIFFLIGSFLFLYGGYRWLGYFKRQTG